MKKSIFEKMTDTQAELNSNNINNDNQISQEVIEKYEIFKKCLNDNGAIYPKLTFPVKIFKYNR